LEDKVVELKIVDQASDNAIDRMTPAKAIRRGGIAKPAHRTISTFDPAMILLDAVIEILAGSVLHGVHQHCTNGARVTVVSIRGYPRRRHAGDRSGGAKALVSAEMARYQMGLLPDGKRD
jgi:hypothetical protein